MMDSVRVKVVRFWELERATGECAAAVPLPQYGIARIIIGQFDRDGRIWQVRFAPDARE